MKKFILTLTIMSLLCLSLAGCIAWKTSEDYELLQDISNIESIRIYSTNYSSDRIYDYSDPEDPCGALLGEILYEQFSQFVDELIGLSFVDEHLIILFPVAFDPNFYYGNYIVKIEYSDGSCELISDIIQRQFTVDEDYPDTIRYVIDAEHWLAFLQKWVELPQQ